MPEGHTLHRLARQITELFVGSPWRVSSPQGRFSAGAALLDGRTPDRAEAWGKHLFVTADEHIWQVHLGLYGAFSFRGDAAFAGAATLGAPRAAAAPWQISHDDDGWVVPAAPEGAVRARVHGRHGWADLRGPATCAVLTPEEHRQVVDRLGPDPLRQLAAAADVGQGAGAAAPPAADLDAVLLENFASRLRRRRVPIAVALMDQAVIAGVGNIYRAESLFLEGLDPDLPARSLREESVESLWRRLTVQLRDGVAEGIIRTLRPTDPPAEGSEAGAVADGTRRHWVYKHQGTPCLRCGSTIAARTVQGRTLYWCPGCQR